MGRKDHILMRVYLELIDLIEVCCDVVAVKWCLPTSLWLWMVIERLALFLHSLLILGLDMNRALSLEGNPSTCCIWSRFAQEKDIQRVAGGWCYK